MLTGEGDQQADREAAALNFRRQSMGDKDKRQRTQAGGLRAFNLAGNEGDLRSWKKETSKYGASFRLIDCFI